MPLIRSALFFSAGFAAGAAAGANIPKLKEKLGPQFAELRDLVGEACTEAACKAAEKVESLQVAMNEMTQARAAKQQASTQATAP